MVLRSKPVYIINGFLESGKTEFITYTLQQEYFQTRGKTLVVLCEEGENEYESSLLRRANCVLELVEDEEQMTPEYMSELEKKWRPERIIIEWNGMWNFRDLKLPKNWKLEQQITTIDTTTFVNYFSNMKSLLAEQVRNSEMVIFNRADADMDLAGFRRSIKTVNPQAEIVFEGKDGEISQMFEDELPFKLDDDPIVLEDQAYGIWYIDSLDNLDRYVGKRVQFVGTVMKPDDYPEDHFIPGRMAMTCCAEDMAFLGFVCIHPSARALKDHDWVKVTATVHKEYWPEYEGEGCVLHAESVVLTSKPKNEVISFV